MDDEAENVWETYIHGALTNPELREARALAKAMGLSTKYVPLHEHKGVNSVLFLIDDFVTAAENKEPPEEVSIPANTIVINTNAIKREYSDFNIYHECVHYYEHYFPLEDEGADVTGSEGSVQPGELPPALFRELDGYGVLQ